MALSGLSTQERQAVSVPTIFTIFGVTGDLAQRKLLPSLFDLYTKDLLPKKLSIVGFSRRPWKDREFREFTESAIKKSNKLSEKKKNKLPEFLSLLVYVQGNFSESKAYKSLESRMTLIEKDFGQCPNKLFHLAVPPSLYKPIFKHLSGSGLTVPCGGDLGWSRVLVEKPFGSDRKTSLELDETLGRLFKEEQIFRIDHYLAKETLQNICYFRFSNAIFEPLWNRKHIDKVEIALLEDSGVSGRGSFYDEVGALRDVGQNHLLVMLSLIAMEKPEYFYSEPLRKRRAEVLSKLKPLSSAEVKKEVVRGQYKGFNEEEGVDPETRTETYFRIKALVKNRRWGKIPFYLKSGKALNRSEAYIKIFFKSPGTKKYNAREYSIVPEGVNQLTFRIQPNEGIDIHFWVKAPGLETKLEEKTLSYFYDVKPEDIPSAYEKLLFDCIKGDHTLFASTQEVQASWKFITSILDKWQDNPLYQYNQGTDHLEIGKDY